MSEANSVAAKYGAASAPATQGSFFRWGQLIMGVICMALIANLQYGWTLFVNPLEAKNHWGLTSIQLAFSIFILVETWLVPIEGWLVDKFGPRPVIAGGAVLAAVGWIMNSYATSLTELYAAAVIAGVGAGCVYGTCVGNALKWFPDKRGLAAGFTAAGFGAGAAVTVIPIANMIKTSGYQETFFFFGILQGVLIFIVAMFMIKPSPPKGIVAAPRIVTTKKDYTAAQMMRTPVFWLTYALFVAVAAGGLMATAQLGPIAKDFHIGNLPVSILGLTLPALTFALSIDRVLNGVTRPFFGWVSDHIGRENTMFIAFGIEAIGIVMLSKFGHDPVLFVILTGVVFFAWGEIYSLFPSTCGDSFGSKYAATNAGLLYTAKGTASLLVPLTSVITATTGSWEAVFYLAAGLNAIAAIMALAVLKPMRIKLALQKWSNGS
jgi:OFA family oxalate/formate antiporter-like MFS transporter